MERARGEALDRRHSVVDLMKALDLDSSYENRVQLAIELGFNGQLADNENMNQWLHREIVLRVAANGGAAPDELL